jgi:hypothetical protein
MNKNIKVFSKIFVGANERTKLGFMTPYEENAAFEKRKATILQWLKSYKNSQSIYENGRFVRSEPDPNSQTVHDNVPLDGFTITDDIKRVYWGGGNVVFRVMDPRGFELEISSQNLMMLISHTDLLKGVIQGKCLWGRDGATNILLHETSEEYASAIKAAETVKRPSKIAASMLRVGGVYRNSQGQVLKYLGKFDVFSRVSFSNGYGYYGYNKHDTLYMTDEASLGQYYAWIVCYKYEHSTAVYHNPLLTKGVVAIEVLDEDAFIDSPTNVWSLDIPTWPEPTDAQRVQIGDRRKRDVLIRTDAFPQYSTYERDKQ